jgi:hypothetical protein
MPDFSDNCFFEGVPVKYAKIITPQGEVRLRVHEYSKIDLTKHQEFIGTEHLQINYLADNPTFAKDLQDKIHYI